LSLEILNLKRLGVQFRVANGDDPFTLVKLFLLLGNDALAFRNRSIPRGNLLPQQLDFSGIVGSHGVHHNLIR
jgi:hypothetical protein